MAQFDLLLFLVQALERLGISYQLTGSTATMVHGEPRFTNDIDVVVNLQRDQVEQFAAAFPDPEFYSSVDAMREAVRLRHQFNIIHPASGQKVDVIVLPDDPASHSQWQRSVRMWIRPGIEASFIAPEDVILRKMEFFREGGSDKHLRDIAGVLKVQGERLDRHYIEDWSARLGLRDIWQAVQQRLQATP
jgi:hypothetical protein